MSSPERPLCFDRVREFLALFTDVPRETVLKIQMGFTLRSREALKRDEKPPYWPLLRHQNTRSRPVQLFSKQFQKEYSRKPIYGLANSYLLGPGLSGVSRSPKHRRQHNL